MSPAERIKAVIDYTGMSTNKLAIELGYARSEILYKVLRGEVEDVSSTLALKVVTRFPEIDVDWLISGQGKMLKNEQYPINSIVTESREQNYNKTPGKVIVRNISIPFYDIEISAGTVNFYKDYPELPHTTLEIPFVQGVDLALPVYGDSMYPKIKNGDIVLLKEITDKTVILYGEIYLVITEDYRTLKYIRKHPSAEDKILLVSENDRYDPVPIALNNVLHLFLYKGKFEKSQI